MKPEMNDTEFAGLELRLRQLRPAQVPVAPKNLHRFIATVPATTAPARPSILRPLDSLALRRGALFVGAAAALVIAVVATSFVVNFRAAQTSAPAASGQWHWQKADGTILLYGPFPVRNGYIGWCLDGVTYTSSICSSPDGVTWTTPADPLIVQFPGNGPLPTSFARLGDVYLMGNSASPMDIETTELWRSTDGVTWTRVDSTQLKNLGGLRTLGVLNRRFVGLGRASDGSGDWAITSADGLTWERTAALGFEPIGGIQSLAGTLILPPSSVEGVMVVSANGGQVWESSDGSTWHGGRLPSGLEYLFDVAPSSAGGFVAVGSGGDAATVHLLRSQDGLTWQIGDEDLTGAVVRMARVSDRLVVSVVDRASAEATSSLNPADMRLWQSVDGGQTWSPVIGPDGHQMSGLITTIGDRLGVLVPENDGLSHLEWVGIPGAASSVVSPEAGRPLQSTSVEPTASD